MLRANGRVRWVSPLPRLVNPDDPGSTPIIWSGPVLVGDRLLIVGSNGRAVTMSPYNGEILGRQELPGRSVRSTSGGALPSPPAWANFR